MSLGSRPCWYIHVLCFPGSCILSIVSMPSLICWESQLTLLWSFRLASNHLPRHFIKCFFSDWMTSSCMRRANLSVTWPFLMTKHLDLLGLNFIRAQDTAWNTPLLYRCVNIVVVCHKLCQALGKYREEYLAFHIQRWYCSELCNVFCISLLDWKFLRPPANMMVSFPSSKLLLKGSIICEVAVGTPCTPCMESFLVFWCLLSFYFFITRKKENMNPCQLSIQINLNFSKHHPHINSNSYMA